MRRPKVVKFEKPKHIKDYPLGPSFDGGHLVEINAGMRTFKPILDKEKCNSCLRCYLLCPEGVIYRTDDQKVEIDYDFCKGCGICEYECKAKAFSMVKEGE